MGVRCAQWVARKALPCAVSLAALGCGESEHRGQRAKATGGDGNLAGSDSAGGSNGGTASGGTASGGIASGGMPGGGSGGSAAGDSGGTMTGGASTGGVSGTSGGGGDVGCPNVTVGADPGIVVTLHGETVEFREDLLWYDGRPPTLDLSARTSQGEWTSLRLFIDPDGDVVVPGVYRNGSTYVSLRGPTAEYSSTDHEETICVSEDGTGEGEVVAGSFTATLASSDGTSSFPVSGTFSGSISPR